MNTNMLPGAADGNSSKLLNVCEIYGLSQLTTEPTRVAAQTQSLIDQCITNTPDKIVRSGVMPLGIYLATTPLASLSSSKSAPP